MNLAIRTARLRSKSPRATSEAGMCLREVRECFAVGPAADDATEAWNNARYKHRETDPRKIPRGVPVFWTGGSSGHGHIAISTGWGKCWSTDILRSGFFDRVPIALISARWSSLQLVGWTDDLNGQTVHHTSRKARL